MKKCSLYELITLTVIFSLSFFAGCSSDKIAGTSEETNEMAYEDSSSSEEELSSSSNESKDVEKSSSSRAVSSSSEKSSSSVKSSSSTAKSSSSSKAVSSSSYMESSNSTPPGATSSSTGVDVNNNSSSSVNPGKIEDGSSSSERPVEGSAKPNTLDYYLDLLNLKSVSFDSGVMSTSIGQNNDAHSQEPNPPMTPEFDSPWPHKIVKQNVDALQEYFPMAFAMYPQIISAIKNETLDENCGLYTFNVYSDGLTAAYIVAEITENVIKVLDVPAGDCKAMSSSEVSRFLFYYCGKLNSHAETEHVKIDMDLSDNCPILKVGNEWVSERSPAPSKKNL
ncbi:hypothetical protein SAMN06298224_0594 [Fibrobacter sp. UWB16]|uniref:hypothetical protein n=1 Tax=Fibrobacter sp. UWB16 TaxID=1945874 RepID=UPI000BCB4864|nr:hypothetical protein [Fibrobacter sp. UWB16]SOD12263.1 hypothetical protein SAMN06298224_0594 [Fibrobacter sp. UWB16]